MSVYLGSWVFKTKLCWSLQMLTTVRSVTPHKPLIVQSAQSCGDAQLWSQKAAQSSSVRPCLKWGWMNWKRFLILMFLICTLMWVDMFLLMEIEPRARSASPFWTILTRLLFQPLIKDELLTKPLGKTTPYTCSCLVFPTPNAYYNL